MAAGGTCTRPLRRPLYAGALLAAALLVSACHGNTAPAPASPDQDAGSCAVQRDPAASALPHDVLTQHNDNARSGATPAETQLDTCNVPTLVQQGAYSVDDQVYAQPLYASNVLTSSGSKNLLVVATTSDSLFAFDADVPGSQPIWQLGTQQELGTPALSSRNVGGNNGILATPVIDAHSGTLFLVSRDCDATYPPSAPHCQQRLFAVALGSGKIVQQVAVQGSVMNPTADAETFFDPDLHWSRAALLEQHGQLFVSFGSGPNGDAHEEDFEFHGWLFGYSAQDLMLAPSVYCSTPGFGGGAIWQSGNGPAADEQGLYFATGNGIHQPTPATPADFPAQPQGDEDSVVRVPLDSTLQNARFWDARAYHADGNVFQYMERNDIDLGTAGPLLIPGSTRLIAGGKSGILYVLERSSLRLTQDPLAVFHSSSLASGQTEFVYSWAEGPHLHGSPAFFRPSDAQGNPGTGLIYYWPSNEQVTAFSYDYDAGLLSELASADVPRVDSGGMLSVSADGARPESAVLWASSVDADGQHGHLWALSATNLSRLWDAQLPAWAKFAVPTVAAGRVYLASSSSAAGQAATVQVFGLPASASGAR